MTFESYVFMCGKSSIPINQRHKSSTKLDLDALLSSISFSSSIVTVLGCFFDRESVVSLSFTCLDVMKGIESNINMRHSPQFDLNYIHSSL